MKRLRMLWLGLALCGATFAQTPSAVRKQAEASMVVTGHIVIEPNGAVRSYALDQQDKLPAPIVDLMRSNIGTWRFEPVMRDGVATAAQAPMNVRVVATPEDDGKTFSLRIAGATFGDGPADEQPRYKQRRAPSYPQEALHARVAGTVYLLVRIGRDGTVDDVSAEQVNLTVVDTERGMQRWRKVLADASVKAAHDWTFEVPAAGAHKDDGEWVVSVPVAFHLSPWGTLDRPAGYGTWEGYIPGPKQTIPWMEEYRLRHAGNRDNRSDAIADDGLHLVGSGLRLTTPLGPS